MSRFGEMCIMENEMKIHSQLDETKLKLDSSSLYYEVDPTGPAPAQRVSSRSHMGNSSCDVKADKPVTPLSLRNHM